MPQKVKIKKTMAFHLFKVYFSFRKLLIELFVERKQNQYKH